MGRPKLDRGYPWFCECGCNRIIPPSANHRAGKPKSRFIKGHMTPGVRANQRAKPKIVPRPEEIPSGLCECGCGKRTSIATFNLRPRRYFEGYPVPFLPGHRLKITGSRHASWKGGRIKSVYGYVLILKPNHPNANKGYIFEHRYVWEQANGRILESHEHIHHINGIKDDNRLENLVMLTSVEHGKEHGGKALIAYSKAHPETLSRAGKLGAAAKWKGHIKRS